MSYIYLTENQLTVRAKTIETKNLKKYRRTPSWLTILRVLRESVIETECGTGISTVNEQILKSQREFCMSEQFALGK